MAQLRTRSMQDDEQSDQRDPGAGGDGNIYQPDPVQAEPGTGDRTGAAPDSRDPSIPTSDPLSQSQEKPSERLYGGGAQASLRRPSVPTPMAGSSSLQPFTPMGDSSSGNLVTPGGIGGGPGLRGMSGGLKGGGLGVPLNPINTAENADLSGLIEQLLKMRS